MFSALNTIYIYLAHLWEMQVKTAVQGKKAMRCIVLSDVSVFPSTAFKGLGHVRAGCVENNLGKFPQKLLVPDVSLQLAKWASWRLTVDQKHSIKVMLGSLSPPLEVMFGRHILILGGFFLYLSMRLSESCSPKQQPTNNLLIFDMQIFAIYHTPFKVPVYFMYCCVHCIFMCFLIKQSSSDVMYRAWVAPSQPPAEMLGCDSLTLHSWTHYPTRSVKKTSKHGPFWCLLLFEQVEHLRQIFQEIDRDLVVGKLYTWM